MAPDDSGGLRDCSSLLKSKHGLKKGPWTTSEDMILIEYVKKHGEGNWNAVQRNSGLMRCGKSCRLRWANHLRPNLKKGAFSPEEEKFIVELHVKYGNKWARMAAQIPGRTDNEIKNYWNTRLKRRQRAGLPVYPQELLQQEQNSSPPSSFSSLLASSEPPNPNPLSFYETFTSPSQNQPNSTPYNINHQLKAYPRSNGSLALSLSASNSSFSSPILSAMAFFNPLPMPTVFQYNSLNYGINPGPDMGVLGLTSIQSSSSSSEFVMTTTSSDGAKDYEVERRCKNSGLLEDLLGESQALKCLGKTEDSFSAAAGNVHENAADFGFNHGQANSDSLESKNSGEGISSMDEEILNLLDNFPLSVPIPDWDEENSSESPILTNGTNEANESQLNAPQYNPDANLNGVANQDWNFGSCLWNYMPGIY